MAVNGTAAYEGERALPALVAAAVAGARRHGFAKSCLPQQGRLLHVLAGGVGAGRIGETGTGCGVGLAWLASGAHPDARLTSVDIDDGLTRRARQVFAGDPRVRIHSGDWRELACDAPFDLLFLDGGGQGKAAGPPLDPAEWLAPGGLVVLDDFTPGTEWPPRHDGRLDEARLYWLDHPRLRTVELRITPDAAVLVGVHVGPPGSGSGDAGR